MAVPCRAPGIVLCEVNVLAYQRFPWLIFESSFFPIAGSAQTQLMPASAADWKTKWRNIQANMVIRFNLNVSRIVEDYICSDAFCVSYVSLRANSDRQQGCDLVEMFNMHFLSSAKCQNSTAQTRKRKCRTSNQPIVRSLFRWFASEHEAWPHVSRLSHNSTPCFSTNRIQSAYAVVS